MDFLYCFGLCIIVARIVEGKNYKYFSVKGTIDTNLFIFATMQHCLNTGMSTKKKQL